MIRSFRSTALKRFWERGDERKLAPEHLLKITRILDLLDAASQPGDMDLPGFKLHPLKGNNAGRFAVTVRANWRITFAWDSEDAIEVDYEDYH
jgi:proteic killer suppression protein